MRKPGKNLVIVSAVSAVVLAAVIGGVLMLDSPAEARLRRFDQRRVEDLREIAYAIDAYWSREESLPPSLEELPDERGHLGKLVDPKTGEPYEYQVLGEDTYELCAVFADDTAEQYETPFRDPWFHGPGRQCFQLKAQDIGRVVDR